MELNLKDVKRQKKYATLDRGIKKATVTLKKKKKQKKTWIDFLGMFDIS